MRQRFSVGRAIAVMAIAATGLAACGTVLEKTYEDDAVLTDSISSVRLDSASGGVTLHGDAGTTKASVHRLVEYRGDRPGSPTYRVENSVLILGGCGGSCSVTYTLIVPAGLPVNGGTSSGAVSLSQVGAVKVTTSSGAITLADVTSAVDVRTANGRITGRGLAGDHVRAQTSNGAIDLVLSRPQDVSAETANGAVTLTMPAGAYRVSTRADHGQVDVGIPNDPTGQHQIEVVTSNGDIIVRSA